MKKVINLRETFCEANKENLKALIKKGYTWTYGTIENYEVLIMESNDLELNAGMDIWEDTENYKEIKLIDGEFYYADSIEATKSKLILGSDTHYCPDCEKQVITKDHHCSIHPTKLNDKDFKEHTDSVFGEECQFAKYGFEKPDFECEILGEKFNALVGWASKDNFPFEAVLWSKKGITSLNRQSHYNLTPIKKLWYEDESNFPCLVKWIDSDNNTLFDTVKSYENGKLKGNVDEYFFPNMVELATKEEVLSLYKEEK